MKNMEADGQENAPVKGWGIAGKFITYILLFSSVITLILTVIQLYMDYRYGLDAIDKSIHQIKESHLEGITQSLWVSDMDLLKTQLDGLLKLNDMQYVDVLQDNEPLIKMGTFKEIQVVTKHFFLSHTYNGKTISLGTLRVIYTLDALYARLMKKALVIIVSQTIKTFMVSGFIFFIFYMLVARHLHAIVAYTGSMGLKNLDTPFVLKRSQKSRTKDEFDMLTTAINKMRTNLKNSYGQIQKEIGERQLAEKAMQQSEAHLRSVFEAADDVAFITTDLAGEETRILGFSPGAQEIFGYSEKEILGKKLSLLHLPGEEKNFSMMQDVLKKGQKGYTGQTELVRKSGEHFPARLAIHPLYDAAGTLTGTLGISFDITAQKKIEQELEIHRKHLEDLVEKRTLELEEKTDKMAKSRQALTHLLEDVNASRKELQKVNREYTAANKELKEFAYIVSHDLKAPLRAISQLTHWISEDYSQLFDDDGREQMALIIKRVKRMDNLIDGILRYSRIGRAREKQERLDLNVVFTESKELLAPPETIKITMDNKLPVVMGDPTRMGQIFQNIMGNAIKFMDKPHGVIRVGCESDGDWWRFSIYDNGPGIDEKYHDKIFQIFQTLIPRDEHESTGIGLTLVKKIIELYGGSIWLKSEPGAGTTFYFTLPKTGEIHENL